MYNRAVSKKFLFTPHLPGTSAFTWKQNYPPWY